MKRKRRNHNKKRHGQKQMEICTIEEEKRKSNERTNERWEGAIGRKAFGVSYIFLKIYVQYNDDLFEGADRNSVRKTC